MKILVYLMTLVLFSTAVAQNPTILTGSYITNVFGNSNFVLNPNAQTGTTNVTNATRSITTPLVATSEFTLALASGANATWTLRAFDAGMKGQNCEARFSYRGFATATSTAQIVQNSLVVATLTLTPSTDPRIASINFPCGDLVNATTFRIAQTTANMTIVTPNEIGGIYVGLATNMANVAQAEFVGDIKFTSCPAAWQLASPTVFTSFSNLGSACTVTTSGTITNSSSGLRPEFGITGAKAGRYMITVNSGAIGSYKSGTATAMNTRLFDGTSGISEEPYSSIEGASAVIAQFMSWRTFNVEFTGAVTNKTINVQVKSTDNVIVNAPLTISVYRFPSSSELVVTPERQNTFGGVKYVNSNQSIRNTSAPSATYFEFNNATWNQPTLLIGKAAVTTTGSGNDLGFSMPNLPVGQYKVSIRGLINASTENATTLGHSVNCSFKIRETIAGTDVALQVHRDTVSATTPTSSRDYEMSFFGVFNNTSVATRNFRLEAAKVADSTTGSVGTCQAYSNAASERTEIVFLLEPLDQPSNSALYVEGPVKAAATGAAIPEGYVNEFATRSITSASIQTQATPAANTYYYPWTGELTLPAGNWLLCYAVPVQLAQTSSSSLYAVAATRIENKTDGTEIVQQIGSVTAGGTITQHITSHSACYPTAITTSKTFRVGIRYIDWAAITTVANMFLRCDQATCRLQAIRLN